MTPERILVLVAGTLNAAAAAILCYPTDDLPVYVRIAVAAVAAGCGFGLAQLNSWSKAG